MLSILQLVDRARDGEGGVIWDAAVYYQSNKDCAEIAVYVLERRLCHSDFTCGVARRTCHVCLGKKL